MADKIGLGSETMELKLGKSFTNRSMGFHSVRYDFKPASVDPKQVAQVDIGSNNQVLVTVPHIEGSGKSETVYQGSKKPYQKECVLIIDHSTGEITLEKLSYNIQLKKTRSEGGSRKFSQRPVTPVEQSTFKQSSTVKFSPSQKLLPSPNEISRISPSRNVSPAQKSPSNLSSPAQFNNSSSSMPVLVPPPHQSSISTHSSGSSSQQHQRKPTSPLKSNMPTFSELVCETQAAEDVGILSDSSSSGKSDDDGSSESELDQMDDQDHYPDSNANGGGHSIMEAFKPTNSRSPLPNMPQLSQLSEDLQLSESDSD